MIKKTMLILPYIWTEKKISPMLSKFDANISTNVSKTWTQYNSGNVSGPIEAICASEVVQWKDVLQDIGHWKSAFPFPHQKEMWQLGTWSVGTGRGWVGLGPGENLEVFSNLNGSMALWDVVALQNGFVWKEDENEDSDENLKLLKKYHL